MNPHKNTNTHHLGLLIEAENVPSDKTHVFEPVLKDIAMQVAAMRPLSIYRDEIDKTLVDKEVGIYKELARKEDKPEQILEKPLSVN